MSKQIISRIRALSDCTVDRILFCFGLILAVSETYKQLFLYFYINHRSYDWWFFPFQLCSLPMYLCLALPFLNSRKLKITLCTFMQDFNLLGGVAALMVSEGFTGIHWSLTLHGYAWHTMLILIGLFIFLSGRWEPSDRGFFRTLPVFVLCCLIATLINVLAPGHGRADMFYISPYHPTTQIVFHQIALHTSITTANILYLSVICLGGYLVHRFFRHLSRCINNMND